MWGMIDTNENDAQLREKFYTIECKRLGKKLRSDRVFNELYIENGVRRFITEEHGYAKWDSEGSMVGYVQSMDPEDILREVNDMANVHATPPLPPPIKGWISNGTSVIIHTFQRPWSPSSFTLRHYWIDLRSCYTITSGRQPRSGRTTQGL